MANACWGIEIGSGAIKALLLSRDGDDVRVVDHALIPHKKPLSTPEIDAAEATRLALGALVNQHKMGKASVAISVPGNAGFARFAKLPPVDPKKKDVAKIVKFEAVQQIPFPIEEVEWDYQTFQSPDSPDVEVGIFAMTRERVLERIAMCEDVGLRPSALSISPIAVYNAIAHDLTLTGESPGLVLLDIGTLSTDLIVAEAGRVWVRTFPMGGHNFTEALMGAFKLPYSKAEKLKRDAEQSKYKRQIFQAMRPVFADFGQEVQRSLTYYKQLHPDVNLTKIIGLGETIRLMGLRKFLHQQTQVDTVRLEQFQRLSVEGAEEGAAFQSHAVNFATAYGLALQGIGLAPIDVNLIPTPALREQAWKTKGPWFATAAALAIGAGAVSFYRPLLDGGALRSAEAQDKLSQVRQVVQRARTQRSAAQDASRSAAVGHRAENIVKLKNRDDLTRRLVEDLGAMLATAQEEGGVRVRSFRFDYLTPTGKDPAWGVYQGPEGRGGGPGRGGGGGGGGGLLNMIDMSPGEEEEALREAPAQRSQAREQPTPHGKIRLRLTVDSASPRQLAFIDSTILQWINDNAEREDALYTFIPIDFNAVAMRELSEDAARGGEGNVSDDLADLAPLAPAPAPAEEAATVHRYTMTWDATLKQPAPLERVTRTQETATPIAGEGAQ